MGKKIDNFDEGRAFPDGGILCVKQRQETVSRESYVGWSTGNGCGRRGRASNQELLVKGQPCVLCLSRGC